MVTFEKYKFLELFDVEEIKEEETAYSVNLDSVFLFRLVISKNSPLITIILINDKTLEPIFKIGIEGISKIDIITNDNHQYIYFLKKDSDSFLYKDVKIMEPFFKVLVKPRISLQYSV